MTGLKKTITFQFDKLFGTDFLSYIRNILKRNIFYFIIFI